MSEAIVLAGDEQAAFSKLIDALRLAADGCVRCRLFMVTDNLRRAVEACVEIGVFRGQWRWAKVAEVIDASRTAITALSPQQRRDNADLLAEGIRGIAARANSMRLMRMN